MRPITDDITAWKVLIVDDEVDNLDLVETIFTHYGAEVSTATDGLEGLDCLQTFEPTVIILDLSMPRMDGWEMIAALQAEPRWAGVPVIALTAHAMIGDRERVLAAGFDGYISKPIRLASFLQEVRAILGLA